MKHYFAVLFLIITLTVIGCGKQSETQPEDTDYQIYYINKDETAVESVGYDAQGKTDEALIEEFLLLLQQLPEEDLELKPAIPEGVSVVSYTLENGQLSLYFDSAYSELSRFYEILCRAAVVRTLCQISGVETVSFLVEDNPLVDSSGTLVGAMSADSFVENAGAAINTYTVATLDLYYANASGDKLVDERVEIRYSSNMSVEKLVVEQLIRGPITENAYPTIPSNTKVLSVSTKEGVCYVNLDEGFLAQEYDVLETIPIYSIVNSLTEIAGISKVQILINGETSLTYRESIRFDTIFERNLDLIETDSENEETKIE